MNRRNFLLACAGLATTPVLAHELQPTDQLVYMTIKNMKIGETITITKVNETQWHIYGDIGERFK